MVRVKITRNHQLTIPAEVREALGIKEGDLVEVLLEGDRAVIIPLRKRRITFKAGRRFSIEELEEEVEKALEESTHTRY